MSRIDQSGTFTLGDRTVKRLGYGAMQLAGPGVFGPPKDPDAALSVLREAVARGVNHIDTSDFYGPSLISTPEMMLRAKEIASIYFRPMHLYVLAGCMYFVMAWPLSLAARRLGKRFQRGRRD